VRVVPIDGRPALTAGIRQWLGSSRNYGMENLLRGARAQERPDGAAVSQR
jgi:hypothetical protein